MGGGFSWCCSVLERKIRFWVLIQSLLSFLQEGKGGGIFGHLRKERKKYKIYSRAQSALYFILWDLHHFHSPQRGGWGCTFSECQKEALGWRGLAWEGRWKRLHNSERKTKCSSTLCWLLSFVQCSYPEHSPTTLLSSWFPTATSALRFPDKDSAT